MIVWLSSIYGTEAATIQPPINLSTFGERENELSAMPSFIHNIMLVKISNELWSNSSFIANNVLKIMK